MSDQPEWDDASFVISSRYRAAAMERLAEGPATPSLIADDSDQNIAHISRAISELREEGLVELLVSEDRKKGRVYGRSEKGAEVWEMIEAQNLL